MPKSNHCKTIVIDDAVPYAKEMFSHLGTVMTLPGKEINAHNVQHADALIVRSRTQVNEALLKNSTVQFVGSTVVGLDHIDQAYLKDQQIHFYSAQGCNANSVAEYVINCLYDLATQMNFDLRQKTLSIIGVGHVGSLVYQKARAIGMQCLLNDPPKQRQQAEYMPQNGQPTEQDSALVYADLDQCLTADIITFHTPLTLSGQDKTYHLLSKARLAKIQPSQIIINAARGGIIDETAWALTQTKANIIDCWENEPTIDPKLYQTAYLATPHIAGHSFEAKLAGSEMVYNALCAFWQTAPLDPWRNQLPPAPNLIKPIDAADPQQIMHSILQQTYNPHQDDQAIRSNHFDELYKKYELYRRNYPIHHEWHRHTVISTQSPELDNLLKSLGFSIQHAV